MSCHHCLDKTCSFLAQILLFVRRETYNTSYKDNVCNIVYMKSIHVRVQFFRIKLSSMKLLLYRFAPFMLYDLVFCNLQYTLNFAHITFNCFKCSDNPRVLGPPGILAFVHHTYQRWQTMLEVYRYYSGYHQAPPDSL